MSAFRVSESAVQLAWRIIKRTVCAGCGLKTWDAPDLVPGDSVCTCDDLFDAEPAGGESRG
jgi:hypothetical protein